MQIGFDAKRLFLNNRGLGSYARNLLYGLQRYAPENTYHLFTPKVKNEHVSPSLVNSSNVKVHLPSGLGKLSSSYWRSGMLGKEANKYSLDVFHGLAQELPLDIDKFRGKSVVTIHDLIFIQHPEFYKPLDRYIYTKKVRFALEKADEIIAISNQTKGDIMHYFNVSEERIRVLYQSCDEVYYNQRTARENEIVKNKWNLPENYLLYVGALNENKNVGVIIKALSIIKDKFDLPLVVIGRGEDYRVKLKQLIRAKRMEGRVIFASDVANPSPMELSSFYQMASLFIFPSYYEGFGIPVIEARFSNTPVVASNSSGLNEAGGELSNYFNPDSAEELAALLLDIENLEVEYPTKFKQELLTEQLVNLYS